MAVVDAVIQERARQAVSILSRDVHLVEAYLFGSHVEGSPDEWSDIDLAVFVAGVEEWGLFRRARMSARVHEEVGNDIELHYFPASVLPDPERASFASWVMRHGVPIEMDGERP